MANGSALWGLPVFCLGEFLRVVTHPRIFDPPTPLEEAIGCISDLLKCPSLRVLCPGERFWPSLAESCREGNAGGNLVFDAQVAALLREHGVEEILTEDRDFSRFPSLRPVSLKGN